MKRWWGWVGRAILAGVLAGAATTLVTDRSWSSELLPRCVTFSMVYLLLGPVVRFSRRRAERRDQQHMGEIEKARCDRRG